MVKQEDHIIFEQSMFLVQLLACLPPLLTAFTLPPQCTLEALGGKCSCQKLGDGGLSAASRDPKLQLFSGILPTAVLLFIAALSLSLDGIVLCVFCFVILPP